MVCVEDVCQVFKKQKTMKASGPDGVSKSALTKWPQSSCRSSTDHWSFLCKVPCCFKRSTIIPVPPKKKKNHWTYWAEILLAKSKNELIKPNKLLLEFVLGVWNCLPKWTFRKSSLRLINTFVITLVCGDYIIGVREGSAFFHLEIFSS